MNWVGGHLGARVSDLLDGQLSPAEEERAWSHVHFCHPCRDLVETEGWVKTRLVGLSQAGTDVPSHLRSALLNPALSPSVLAPHALADSGEPRALRVGLVALGSGAAGAAVMGILALGAAPAQAPTIEPRTPTSSPNAPAAPVSVGPGRREVGR